MNKETLIRRQFVDWLIEHREKYPRLQDDLARYNALGLPTDFSHFEKWLVKNYTTFETLRIALYAYQEYLVQLNREVERLISEHGERLVNFEKGD